MARTPRHGRRQAGAGPRHGARPRRRPLTPYQREQREETRRRVLHAIAGARGGSSLSRAVRQEHTTLRAVRTYAPSLVSPTPSGRLEVTPYDRMTRPMRVLTEWGVIVVDIRDSRSASSLGRYANASKSALTGNMAALEEFRGRVLRVGKMSFPYITDMNLLRRLHYAGELQYEDLYDTTR